MSKNNKNKLVPRLRFPEFQHSGEWEVKEVGEIFEITRGYVLPMNLLSKEYSSDNPYPVYSSQTKNNGLAGYYKDYLYEDAITWTTDGANAGDVNFRKGKFYCTNVCGVLINKEGYSNKCVAELINAVSKKYVSYVGNPKLMNGVMSKIKIPFPSLPEQQKIASCLSSLDEVIAGERQKLELLQQHKKGLLQQLFPQEGETVPRLRFPEFQNAGEWEVKRLGEVFSSYSGGTPNTSKKEYYGGDIPFIRSAEINKEKTELFLTELGLQNSSAKMVSKGDLLIALYGANSGDVAISKIDGAINQAVLCLKSEFSNSFAAFYLSGKKDWIVSKYIQGGQGNLSGEIVKSIPVPFPKKSEQQKIAACLSSLDDLITAQTQKIELLEQHKKGLLQGLFPMENG
jgi:type I restriction enzyme S subunit